MTFRSSPALQTVCGTSAFGCSWPSEGRRSKLHSSSGCGGQLSPIFWSHRAAGGWLGGMRSSLQQQSLLAKQPRSPAELRTDRMLPPSYFKAKDDIPRIRLSPGPRHHNRHFDYLLCHIIFHWRHSCQKKKIHTSLNLIPEINLSWLIVVVNGGAESYCCGIMRGKKKDGVVFTRVRWKIILLAW